MPFNLLKSKLQYCNPFQNASTTNDGMLPNSPIVRQIWLPWQYPLRDHKVIYQVIEPFYMPTDPEFFVKISSLVFEIPELKVNL